MIGAVGLIETARFTAFEKNGFLCVNSVALCVSVVKLLREAFTTEAQSLHREPQRRSSDRRRSERPIHEIGKDADNSTTQRYDSRQGNRLWRQILKKR